MAVNVTAYASTKEYKYHVENLRELERALTQTSRLARLEISRGDGQESLRSLLRVYAFLLGAWAECRLRKLLHESGGFTAAERARIEGAQTQLDQWTQAIDIAFRRHHKLPKAKLSSRTLGVAHAARRQSLHAVLSDELRIIIEIRNKLAHGQWVYPFNSDGTQVDSVKFKLINLENLLSLQFKYALIGHLADMVHDLVVSPMTFERDFESHFRKLEQVRVNLRVRQYSSYERSLISSRQKQRASVAQAR